MVWSLRRTLAYVLVFSVSYSLFELYGQPCNLLPWCSYGLYGLALYQYSFMLPLFTLVALIPARADFFRSYPAKAYALGTFFLTVLAEDWFYFLFEFDPIHPGLYTTQWGYLLVAGWVVPLWYLPFLGGAIVSFYAWYRFCGERNAPEKHVQRELNSSLISK
jgi:hypothetical protein